MNYTIYSDTPHGPVTAGMLRLIHDTGFGAEVRPGSELPPNPTGRDLKLPRVYYGDLQVGRFRGLRKHLISQLVTENSRLHALANTEDDGSRMHDPARKKLWLDRRVPVTHEQIIRAVSAQGVRVVPRVGVTEIVQAIRNLGADDQSFTVAQIASAVERLGADGMQASFLDRKFWATTQPYWDEIIEATEVDEVRYVAESSDCEDFAKALAGIVPLKFGVNAIGIMVDLGSVHAYNVIVVADGDRFIARGLEPQSDRLVQLGQGSYPASRGVVIF